MTRIYAAAGTADITPQTAVPLAGSEIRTAAFTGVADPLEANALVLRQGDAPLVIVSVDLMFVGRELRSAVESRRSLTKFITIIVIAVSLEALVMAFETGRTDVTHAIYPAALFTAAMFALLALGAFQWLSSRIAPPPEERDVPEDAEIDHHATDEAAEPPEPSRRAPRSGGTRRRGKE